MANPVRGDDNGVGYGVEGTSVPAIGVKGLGGKAPFVIGHGGTLPSCGVYGYHYDNGYGVYGSSVSGVAVYGYAASSSQPSVQGEHHGPGTGVQGSSVTGAGVSGASQSGDGVAGHCPNGTGVSGTSNQYIGVWGTCNNPNLGSIWGDSQVNAGAGVVGNSVNGYAIWGQSTTDATKLAGGQSYANVGVFGIADLGNGVLGQSDRGAAVAGVATTSSGLAGFFNGNVQVTGFLSKGGSNFQIDHPLDPANKFLTHAAVESDQQKNFYDGLVKLNRQGEAEVRLPRWFAAINRDLCYQLTPIGAPAPDLHIAAVLRNGKFRISGGHAGQRICWQVTAIRSDRWAKANPLVVETPKPRQHRGKYLHPELYGKKKESGIGWIAVPPRRFAERSRKSEGKAR